MIWLIMMMSNIQSDEFRIMNFFLWEHSSYIRMAEMNETRED